MLTGGGITGGRMIQNTEGRKLEVQEEATVASLQTQGDEVATTTNSSSSITNRSSSISSQSKLNSSRASNPVTWS